jgi:hypothetical protein
MNAKKAVHCYHCGKELLVSVRAFSTCCPKCNQRLGVEDRTISGHYEITLIETCGTVQVGPAGDLRSRLRVRDLQVQGQCQGNIVADGKVSLDSNARVEGDITAKRLEVNPGARLKGYYRIGSGS